MNYRNITILLILSLVTACKKQDTTQVQEGDKNNNTAPPTDTPANFDRRTIPTGDVNWKIHYQGATTADTNNPAFSFFDTSFHVYLTITGTGKDTVIKPEYGTEHTYHQYKLNYYYYQKRTNTDYYETEYQYVRYDTKNNKLIYILHSYSSQPYNEETGIDFNLQAQPNMLGACAPKWYTTNCSLVYGDSVKIYGTKYPTLYMKTGDKKYFYQSPGIGGINAATNCAVSALRVDSRAVIRSLEFKYKDDSYSFEYPYQ